MENFILDDFLSLHKGAWVIEPDKNSLEKYRIPRIPRIFQLYFDNLVHWFSEDMCNMLQSSIHQHCNMWYINILINMEHFYRKLLVTQFPDQ